MYGRREEAVKFLGAVIPLLSLLAFFMLGLQAAVAKAPTADEGMHLLRGATLWQSGELSLQGQHAPLSHWLNGFFLRLEPSVPTVAQLPAWPDGSHQALKQAFMWQSGANVERMLFLGRLAPLFGAVLLGAALLRWARHLGGRSAQIVTGILFAFSPNLLASAALATTDALATVTFVAALFALARSWQRPGWGRGLLAGVVLGLALASKITALLLLPLTLLLALFIAWRQQRPLRWTALAWAGQVAVAALVLWATYGFEIRQLPGWPAPIPAATYVNNFVAVQDHIERGHYAFLLGERSQFGWWYYFLVAFFVKTPAVTLILLGATAGYLSRQRRWLNWNILILWLPAVAVLAAASASGLNIGYRHILPALPLLWLAIATVASTLPAKPIVVTLLTLALGSYVLLGLRQAPHYLAYFNEFVGGSANGYQILGDSNLDWGQDLILLADYVNKHDDQELRISYAGAADPAYYGLEGAQLLDRTGQPRGFAPANPAPGRYLISAGHLQSGTLDQPDLFDYFRSLEPVDQIGYSILIFDVREERDGAWVGHCRGTESAIDEAMTEQYLGRENLRHVYFGCRSSWVFPVTGPKGWYVLPFERGLQPEAVLGVGGLELVFINEHNTGGSPYRIAYWSGQGDLAAAMKARSWPLSLPDGSGVEAPALIDDHAALLGGWAADSRWVSAWRTQAQQETPLTVLMHLYTDPAGAPLVGDGLGYSPIQWQTGDIFLQIAEFQTAEGQFLETGLYNYVTGERLPFAVASDAPTAVRFNAPNETPSDRE